MNMKEEELMSLNFHQIALLIELNNTEKLYKLSTMFEMGKKLSKQDPYIIEKVKQLLK